MSSTSEEIASLRAIYGPDCRVLSGIGDVTHMVDIKPHLSDISFKFQLMESYPQKEPEIIIRSSKLSPDQLDALHIKVNGSAISLVGTPMISALIKEAFAWIKQEDVDISKCAASGKKSPTADKTKKKQKKLKKKFEDDVENEKKTSMKTAEDVISRIVWDENLQTDAFVIGYLDRFVGVVEKNFSSFSWEDIASVDYNTLAIPKHRIQYFKYKKVKVWEKAERLDNVFGSTGSELTIHDVIAAYTEDTEEAQASGGNCSDSDDDVQINFGEFDQSTEAAEADANWEDKLRPNHFLCLRITDQEIVEGVNAIQESILDNEPGYVECYVPPCCLHVTLSLLGLDTPEQVTECCQALERAKDQLIELAQHKIKLKFNGVGHFYNRVLYAKIQHDKDFADFIQCLETIVTEAGFPLRNQYDFTPHLTIMKTNPRIKQRLHTKFISPALYEHFSEMYFGEQLVDAVHLCDMTSSRDSEGFYIRPTTIQLLADGSQSEN